jgi:PAS domain S-box-containing protein
MRASKYADLIPLVAFLVVVGIVFLFDRERGTHPQREVAAAEAAAERRASALADVLGNEVSARLGSLAAARVNFASVVDAESEAVFMASMDSVVARTPGLTGISLVYPGGEQVVRTPGSGLDRMISLEDTLVRRAYVRALGTHRPAATDVVDWGFGRRVFVFDPISRLDTANIVAVLAAELDPQAIYREASQTGVLDTIPGGAITHALYGAGGVRLSTQQVVPAGWSRVMRQVRVADTSWQVEVAFPLPDLRAYRAERLATWVAGLALALAVAVILHFLRRTIRTQKEEIARRQAAEEAAGAAAEEARQRAQQARELAAQLEAAQRASQRLSTSLDPDDVVEQFLGGVAEILDVDVASLYTFEEEGELLVGRRRMVFRDLEGITDRLRQEDITQVSAPVALLPTLAEAVSTGEPFVVENADEDGRPLPGTTGETAAASVTVPLLIAGHTVGVATWEVYSSPRRFQPALVAFAQALGAPAAAALRTAELFSSLEAERRRAAREAVRFGAVLDQMADGVIVVDAQGRLERSNASAEELLGADLAEAPVAEWPGRYDLVSPEGRPLGVADFPLSRAMRGERVRRATFIVRSDWGAERHLSCSAGPILNRAGEPAGAAMVLRDVSDEHQYAEMLRHTNRELRRQAEVLEQVNQQLREATKAKDQFLAVMSHELRTPINAIMGYSDLLDLGVKGPLNDDQRSMLNRVRETSRHLLGLINEVLDLAKIGAGRMDLVVTDLDAEVIVERAAQQVLPLAAAKGLHLTVEEPPPEQRPVLVRADETRLTQIIVNLLSNAVKFTATGGLGVACARGGGDVLIHVRDTGPGIAPDEAERIFEEFYQVEGGLSRASGGTGLGLAIARRFARLMGGDIIVESRVGAGSVFTVRLPAAAPGEGADVEEEDGLTLLLLARDEAMVESLEAALGGTPRLVAAMDPAHLAAVARRERPGLVAVDTSAPEQAAWRALTALLGEPATADLPALLLAHPNGDAARAVDLGLITLLPKPLSVDVATERVLGIAGAASEVTVLIADDDPDVRRILGEALSAAGCDVRTASSGGEALEVARRIHPDVAILDLLMPGMDGVEAIATMRREAGLRDVPVVALLNGAMDEEEMRRLTEAAADVARRGAVAARPTAELLRRAAEEAGGAFPGRAGAAA